MEKLFPVAERFYALYREQFNPDLTVPESVVEEWIARGNVLSNKNHRQAATGRRLDVCPNSPTLIIKVKDVSRWLRSKVSRRLKQIEQAT